jgi:hypothetical protein
MLISPSALLAESIVHKEGDEASDGRAELLDLCEEGFGYGNFESRLRH